MDSILGNLLKRGKEIRLKDANATPASRICKSLDLPAVVNGGPASHPADWRNARPPVKACILSFSHPVTIGNSL